MPSWIDVIAAQLDAADVEERSKAAQELLPLARRYPRAALDILESAIPSQTDEGVLFHLLRCTYHTLSWPQETLSCLERSRAVIWNELPWHTGVSLAVLSRLAAHEPTRVATLLPADLSVGHPNAAALFAEIHARAWWACAEWLADAQERLTQLMHPILEQVEDKFRMFAVRGAAVAALGAACTCEQPTIGSSEQIKEIFYHEQYCPALFLELDDFLNAQAANVVDRDHYGEMVGLMIQSLEEYDLHQVHPIEKPLVNMQFQCARETVEGLAGFASLATSPLTILARMPRDWQALMGAGILLERGIASAEVSAFAREACEEHASRGTANAFHERNRCLAAMAAHEDDPVEYYRRLRASSVHRSSFLSPDATVLSKVTDLRPPACIELMDEHLAMPTDLATLYEWSGAGIEWQPALLGTVIKRCFDESPMSMEEAQHLCEATLAVSQVCDSGIAQNEWTCMYESLAVVVRGEHPSIELEERPDCLFNRAHRATCSLLRTFAEPTNGDRLVEWLGANYSAWIEDAHHAISKQGGIAESFGSYHPLTFVFPSVRIAIVASCNSELDPAAMWFESRHKVADALKEHKWTLDPQLQRDPERIQRAVADLAQLVSECWWDHRLLGTLAAGLLRLDEPQRALEVLSHFDMIIGPSNDARAHVEYNRACAHARLGDEEMAKHHLLVAVELGWRNADWLEQDPDFEDCRDAPWFAAIVDRLQGQ